MKVYHPNTYISNELALSRDFKLEHAITRDRIYFQLVYDFPSVSSFPFSISFSLAGYTLVRLPLKPTEIDFCVTIRLSNSCFSRVTEKLPVFKNCSINSRF